MSAAEILESILNDSGRPCICEEGANDFCFNVPVKIVKRFKKFFFWLEFIHKYNLTPPCKSRVCILYFPKRRKNWHGFLN